METNQIFAMKAHLCRTSDGDPITFLGQSTKFGLNINAQSEGFVCGDGKIGDFEFCEKGLYKEGANYPATEFCVDPRVDPPHWSSSGEAGECSIGCNCIWPVPNEYPVVCDGSDGCDGDDSGGGEPTTGEKDDVENVGGGGDEEECTSWKCLRSGCALPHGAVSSCEQGTYLCDDGVPSGTHATEQECEDDCDCALPNY